MYEHGWLDVWGDSDAVRDLLFRGLFALITLMAAWGPLRELGSGGGWRSGTLGARAGDRLSSRAGRTTLGLLLAVSAGAFTAGVALWAALVLLAAGFHLLVVVYLSQEHSGYTTEEDDGTKTFHVHHHLHLLGMTLLAMVCTVGVLGPAGAAGPGTSHAAQALWGAIAAHYVVAAVAKVRKRGLRWPDRRLFPFYLTLFARYSAGDGQPLPERGPARALTLHPQWGVLLLWAALLLEFSTPVMLIGYGPRLVIAVSLVVFHLCCRWWLMVDFRENAMLAALAALPLPHDGHGLLAPESAAVPLAVAAACAAVSLILGDRVYPFSSLPMFTAPYRPATVISLRSPDGTVVHPAPAHLGSTTSALSRQYDAAAARNQVEAFLAELRDTAAARGTPLPGEAVLWREVVTVSPEGRVDISQTPLERHPGAGPSSSTAAD
ncbi:hypothetical protein GCM10009549_09300 [Streptomyces thermoalcalitolerans]|uniref:HTTM domain-containing protein n=2 Tax=Streptomyces thermoalcalitolerans TaxID=65605 RepID=A0ABN1NF77_9ACTN